jgi:DnaJ-class molecular chaperone
MSDDHYTTLGLGKDCTSADITTAYRTKAMQWHPDRSKEKNAATMFQKVTEAYNILSNPLKKSKYDKSRKISVNTRTSNMGPGVTVVRFTSTDANDMFENICKGNAAPRSKILKPTLKKPTAKPTPKPVPVPRPKIPLTLKKIVPVVPPPAPKKVFVVPKQSEPVHAPKVQVQVQDKVQAKPKPKATPKIVHNESKIPLACTLEEIYEGKKKIVKTIQGKLVIVQVPPGSLDGQHINVKNADTGNFDIFIIHEQKHNCYRRDGCDLHMTETLSLADFVNGFCITIILLNGKKKSITHKYNGRTIGPELYIKLANMGLPKHDNPETFGSLFIHFKVVLPSSV